MMGVQKFEDILPGQFSAIALVSLHLHSRGVLLAKARGQLHFTVNRVIVRDVPANEPQDEGPAPYGRIVRRKRVSQNQRASCQNGRGVKNKNANGRKRLPAGPWTTHMEIA